MTLRERILAVYRGETPDVVPYMLDLSHWFYHKNRQPWDLSLSYDEPEYALIDYHKRTGVGFYIPNLAAFYTADYGPDVVAETTKSDSYGAPEITWRLTTPLGAIERKRRWEESTYSWAISQWGVHTEQDLRVLGYALGSRRWTARWDRYQAWQEYAGDYGVPYMLAGYSAMGHLLNYWMGIGSAIYAAADWPGTLHAVVDQINDNTLKLVDLLAQSPAEVVCMGDNFSSDVQSPRFFAEWSRPYYAEAIRRLHAAGKYVAVHIDGRMRGALAMFREIGADCCDAATPAPMGDLTPGECRDEAGPHFILSGGVSPDLWYPHVSVDAFKRAIGDWLDLRQRSPRLIANAGDQVPPGAAEDRIAIMRDMVEQCGKY
jgi:hypothetical protein